MFKGVLQDVSFLKDGLDAISSFITEGTFNVSSEGMELIAMDAASVAMTILKVLPTAFLEYNCDKEEAITINLVNFVNILKRAKSNDRITLELADNRFKIKMHGDFKRNFSIPLIDISQAPSKVQDMDFKCRMEVISGVIKDGIKDASMVSDCVVFQAENNSFYIKSLGELSETSLEIAKDAPALISIECQEDARSKYSIDYLDKMMKAVKSTEKIILRFSKDFPLRIDYSVIDRFSISFVLAPRVDTD